MIDFDNIDTIPNSIIALINKKRELIRSELLLDIKRTLAGHQWKGGTVSIENYNKLLKIVIDLLKNEKILGFHCTKHINPRELLKTGLNKLNPREYEIWMKKFLKSKLNDEKTIKEIDNCFAKFNEHNEYKHRENMIWFLINRSLVHDSGCKYFFKYYGGEVIKRLAYPIKDTVFPILIQTGIPTVVEFEFEFKELTVYHQHNLVNSLIKSKIFEKSYTYYNEMQTEGYVTRDIKPQDIVEVYFDSDITRLKNIVISSKLPSKSGFGASLTGN